MDEFTIDLMGDAMNINMALGQMMNPTGYNEVSNNELNIYENSHYDGAYALEEQSSYSYQLDEEYNYYDDVKLEQDKEQPCEFCKRTFLPEILERHRNVCYKHWLKNRDKQSKFEKDLVAFCNANQAPKELTPLEKVRLRRRDRRMQWRQRHEDFIAAVRAAREYALAKRTGKELPPPPPPAVNREHIKCEICSRSFNRSIIARHVEHCKEKQKRQAFNKPTYSAAQIEAKKRLATRLTYTPTASPMDSLLNSMFNTPQSSRPMSRAASCFPNNLGISSPNYPGQRPLSSMNTANVLNKAADILKTHVAKPQSRVQALKLEHKLDSRVSSSPGSPCGSLTRSVTPTQPGHVSQMARQQASSPQPDRYSASSSQSIHPAQHSPGRSLGSPCPDRISTGNSPDRQILNSKKQVPVVSQNRILKSEKTFAETSCSDTSKSATHAKTNNQNILPEQKNQVQLNATESKMSTHKKSHTPNKSPGTVVGINNIKLEVAPSSDLPDISGDIGQAEKSSGDILPKFCHECGSKYNTTKAKFCCECGCKRILPACSDV